MVSAGVSGDGSSVVGLTWSNLSYPFRWRQSSGTRQFPPYYVPRGDGYREFGGRALATSHNGNYAVGDYNGKAVRWNSIGEYEFLRPDGGNATPFGISANGSVVVGDFNASNGIEAFRWTSATGMVGLGDLPTGTFHSEARGVSGDGNVVVGCLRGPCPHSTDVRFNHRTMARRRFIEG